MKQRRGNILIFSLMIMGVITFVTQQLVKSVTVGTAFSRAMVDREQAEMLALSGLRLATVELARSVMPEKQKGVEQVRGQVSTPVFSFKNFIEQVLPHLDRWQQFDLVKEIDGCDGQIKVCISAEDGKIPINTIFDEQKRVLKDQAKTLLKSFGIKKKIAAGTLPAKLATFFKKRTAQVGDISELSQFAHVMQLPLFYEPPTSTPVRGEDVPPRDIAIQSMFTTWGSEKAISPLLMSDALCALFHVRRPEPQDATRRADRYKRLAEVYNQVKNLQGDEMWKQFQILFETKPRLPKEITGLFSPVVEPRFFSVVSCGKVGEVSQKVLAIIERVDVKEPADKQKQSGRQTGKPAVAPSSLFHVRRLYWI